MLLALFHMPLISTSLTIMDYQFDMYIGSMGTYLKDISSAIFWSFFLTFVVPSGGSQGSVLDHSINATFSDMGTL